MTYNIIGIFRTIDDVISAAKQLTNAGFIKQFPGFTKNSKFQPESLVEDHFIDQNEISVYTPNLNRAHKAKNILIQFGAELNKIKGLYYEQAHNSKPTNTSLILFNKRKQLTAYKMKSRQGPIDLLNNK